MAGTRDRLRRVEVTLGGMRIEPHPKTPAGLVGLVVPWDRVKVEWVEPYVRLFDAGVAGLVTDGRALGRVRLDALRHIAARRARERWLQRAFALPGYRREERFTATRDARRLGVAALLAGVLVVSWMSFDAIREVKLLATGQCVTGAILMVFMAASAAWFAWTAWKPLPPRIRRVVYTDEGMAWALRDGREIFRRWGDVKDIHRSGARVSFNDGTCVVLPLDRHRDEVRIMHQRLHPDDEARLRRTARLFPWMMIGFIHVALGVCFVGGLIWGPAWSTRPPEDRWGLFTGYLVAAWALPLLMMALLAWGLSYPKRQQARAAAQRQERRARVTQRPVGE